MTCCGARSNLRAYAFPRFDRPLPLAHPRTLFYLGCAKAALFDSRTGKKEGVERLYPSTAVLLIQMPLTRHGNLPRPKNVPPARFLNGLSIPVRQKENLLRKQEVFLFGELRNLGYKYYALIRRQFHVRSLYGCRRSS